MLAIYSGVTGKVANFTPEWVANFSPESVANFDRNRWPTCPGIRMEVKEDGEGILVHALPGGNFDAVRELDAHRLFSYVDSALDAGRVKELGEVLLFYECRCTDAMISRIIDNMEEADRRDMFGDLPHVEIECPRCGRKYTVASKDKSIH